MSTEAVCSCPHFPTSDGKRKKSVSPLALCQLIFQAALHKVGSKKRLWEKIRAYFLSIDFDNMELLYKAIVFGYHIERIVILDDSS